MPSAILCLTCRRPTTLEALAEASWADLAILDRLARQHPNWRKEDGACPACVQQALLQTLLEQGDDALHHGIQVLRSIQ